MSCNLVVVLGIQLLRALTVRESLCIERPDPSGADGPALRLVTGSR
jgi:hypothetical protein